MRQLYCFLLLCICLNLSYSQVCVPDSIYRDSSAGVYPKPITPDRPNGGITKKACINRPYDFTMTVIIPDTLTVPGIPFLVNLEYAKINPTGAISNLPEGIGYECNPPDCKFLKKTQGCIILKGTPTSANTPKDYKPIIMLTMGTSFGPIDISYPGPQFPGEYILTLLDESCNVASKDVYLKNNAWYPNPCDGFLFNPSNHVEEVKLINSQGQLVQFEQQINGALEFNHALQNGVYLLMWRDGELKLSQRIMLMR